MRTENENSFENSREEKLLKLYEKNKISENLRQTINEKKLHNLKNLEKNREEKFKLIQEKINKANRNHELQRLSVQSKINKNLAKISINQKSFYENQNKIRHNKNCVSVDKFLTKYEHLQTEKILEFEKIKERPIGKFENWYVSHYQNKLKEMLSSKKNTEEKRVRSLEKSFEIEEELKKKGQKIMLRYENNISKNKEKNGKNIENIHLKEQFNNERYLKIINNQSEIKKEIDIHNRSILENQSNKISVAKKIEEINTEQKHISRTKNQFFYMEGDKKILTFYKELFNYKSQSLMKKSPEEKKKIYSEIKKKEDEERKKNEELNSKLDKTKA